MLCRDYVGRTVRLKRTLRTKGGVEFAAGTEMLVDGTYRGTFELSVFNPIRGLRDAIRKVSKVDFEVMP